MWPPQWGPAQWGPEADRAAVAAVAAGALPPRRSRSRWAAGPAEAGAAAGSTAVRAVLLPFRRPARSPEARGAEEWDGAGANCRTPARARRDEATATPAARTLGPGTNSAGRPRVPGRRPGSTAGRGPVEPGSRDGRPADTAPVARPARPAGTGRKRYDGRPRRPRIVGPGVWSTRGGRSPRPSRCAARAVGRWCSAGAPRRGPPGSADPSCSGTSPCPFSCRRRTDRRLSHRDGRRSPPAARGSRE